MYTATIAITTIATMQGKSIKVKLLWNIYGDVELNQNKL